MALESRFRRIRARDAARLRSVEACVDERLPAHVVAGRAVARVAKPRPGRLVGRCGAARRHRRSRLLPTKRAGTAWNKDGLCGRFSTKTAGGTVRGHK